MSPRSQSDDVDESASPRGPVKGNKKKDMDLVLCYAFARLRFNIWACAIFIETLGDVCSLPSILILKFHVVSTDFFIFGFCFHVCTCRASNCCCQLLRWRGWRTSKKEGLGDVFGDSKWLEMMTPYHWTVATHQSEAAGDMCWYCLELVYLSWHLLSTGW